MPCLDSEALATRNRTLLELSRFDATILGESAVTAIEAGYYSSANGTKVDWLALVENACQRKVSIGPDAPLPDFEARHHPETKIQVSNETTLIAARRLRDEEQNPLVLNFANGVSPGGGFLNGARAQEETLCRSSALYATLKDDPMYAHHRQRPLPDSSNWAIYSPDVPVFRTDDGQALAEPWLMNVLTCAAPYAPGVGRQQSASILKDRIHRILAIARAYGYDSLVLGAWGYGAFGNDARQTASDFKAAFEIEFQGAFSDVLFAITDWSQDRRFLSPFREIFSDH